MAFASRAGVGDCMFILEGQFGFAEPSLSFCWWQ
jgi:hypothetical protein